MQQGFVETADRRDAAALDEHGVVANGTQRRLRLETPVRSLELDQDHLVVTRRRACMICRIADPIERFEHTSQDAAATTMAVLLGEAREGDYRVGRSAPFEIAEHRHPVLEANCSSDDAWPVYADWLLARHDPRGELAALLQRDPTANPDEYVRRVAPALFGSMAEIVSVADWRQGFARELTIANVGAQLADVENHVLQLPISIFVDTIRSSTGRRRVESRRRRSCFHEDRAT